MAISWSHLTGGSGTSLSQNTASITPTANAQVFVSVVVSMIGGNQTTTSDALTVSGGNLTWTEVGYVKVWGARRGIYVWRGVGASPTTGALTILFDPDQSDAAFEQMKWDVDEATGVDATTPIGAAFTNSTASAAALAASISETPDAGDNTYAAIGLEDNNDTSLNTELDNTLYEAGDTTGARHIHVGYDSSPDSTPAPGFTWSGNCAAGIVGFIVNAAAGEPPVEGGGIATLHYYYERRRN